MRLKETINNIRTDYSRFANWKEAFASASFPVSFWFRIATYFKSNRFKIIYYPLYLISVIIFKIHKLATGIQLPVGTKIGGGVKFFHYNCIIIAQSSIIGENSSIHQGVTIGRVFNGPKAGCPTIGNNVVIFAGAKIIGNVHIGDHTVIGANAVVTSSIPANSVCVGVPAKIISDKSKGCFDKEWLKIFAFE